MISVIIGTYNQAEIVGRAIESVLMQQCSEDVEILIADDASVDGTADVCRDYQSRFPDKIRLIVNKENKGLVDNYYDTLLECRGDLVADCAGDDCWCDPLKLQKELDVMRSHPEVKLVHTAWKYYNIDTGELKDSPQLPFTAPFTDGREMLEAIITQTTAPVVHLCTSLYRKEVFMREYNAHRELFRNKILACEDVQLIFAMALHGKIAFLPDVTLHYSYADGSVSCNKDDRKQFRFVHRVTELSHMLSTVYNIKGEATQDYFSLRVYELLMHSFRCYSPSLRDEAFNCMRQWGCPSTRRIRLVGFCTSNHLVWALCLGIRNIVVFAKRLFSR